MKLAGTRSGLLALAFALGTLPVTSGCAGMRIGGAAPEALRSRTIVVHVKSSKRVATLFHAIASEYRAAGENEKADFFDDHVSEGFGSGFVVRAPSAPVGQSGSALMFAVTNRHVVDLGDEPEIEIPGTGQRLAAEVVYTDPVHDVAVIAPKNGWPGRVQPMSLSTMPPHDLDEVIATGYPALGGNPSYQSTQGSVSNSNVALGSATFIQHSAPIDPGSSGGPLLNTAGFVIGVNTGKAPGRDNVYLAVPSKAVKEALVRAEEAVAQRKNEGWEGQSLRAACRSFAAGITSEEIPPSTIYAIGDDLVAERGFESLRVVDTDRHTTARDRVVLRAAFQREPVALLRLSVALRLWLEAHEDGPAVACTTSEEPNAGLAKLSIQFQNRTRETVWRFEQGQWRLAAIGGLKTYNNSPPSAVAQGGGAKPVAKDSTPAKKTKDAPDGAKPARRGPRELPRR